MKKILMIAVMAVAAVSANAQWYIGGSFGLNFTKATKDADSQTTLNIAPEVGYNINDNWAVGAQVGFGMVNNLLDISEGSANETGTSFTITPYARYTFAKTGIASFFCDGYVSFSSQNYGYNDFYKTTVKYGKSGSVFSVGIRPGISLKASDKVSLVAILGNLSYTKNSDDVLGGGSNFGINADNNDISLGVYYNF